MTPVKINVRITRQRRAKEGYYLCIGAQRPIWFRTHKAATKALRIAASQIWLQVVTLKDFAKRKNGKLK